MSKPVDYAAMTEKRCPKCEKTKPVSEFGKHADASAPLTGWRYYSWCLECSRAQSRRYGTENRARRNARLRQWRKANPERAAELDRAGRLRHKYGLSVPEAEALLAANDGKCLICNDQRAVAIDHCHTTGRVRGGLCISCNTFLGRAEANPAILMRMANYAGITIANGY